MYFPMQTAKLEQALKGLVSPFFRDNVSVQLKDEKVTKENIDRLNKYYKSIGIDYRVVTDLASRIEAMPFNQTIKLGVGNASRISSITLSKDKFESFNYGVNYGKYNDVYYPLGVLEKDLVLPSMTDKNGVKWMTPVYFEEVTMRPAVHKAKGNVLKFGLGIGFFPFNCLLKDNVEKVTIIERDLGVIETFKRDILPQFPRSEAIEIIHGDAFDYVNSDFLQQFDFVYVDIWLNNEDGTVTLSKLLSNMSEDVAYNEEHINYWIEDAILSDVLASVGAYLSMDYRGTLDRELTGVVTKIDTIENYVTFDKIHRFMQENYAGVTFRNEKELLSLVKSRTFLLRLLRSFSL